jgi:phospholysine phosphohistidine inorganic pyrophosphate phosphatase
MHALLLDLDGVIYQAGKAIAGSVETLNWVREKGIPCLFLTNTTSRPRAEIVTRLAQYGIRADTDDILTPPVAACRWLQQNIQGALALFIPAATRDEFSQFTILDESEESGATAVVVGDMGEGWSFNRLNQAFRLLQDDPDAVLVALGMTRYWRAPEGLRLDTGPFVQALSFATGKTPRVVGKPAPLFFRAALDMLGCDAEATLMIGDDIRTDIEGARDAGLKTALVKTGKYRDSDLDLGIKPDMVFESVAELPQHWHALS